jgi:nitroreductase
MSSVQLDSLFSAARTHSAWQDTPVSDAQLHAIYELLQWGPTSANCSPMRVVFVKSDAEKAKLIPCMHAGNQEKTQTAPVTAIIGMNMAFYDQLPQLFPHADARAWFVGNQAVIDSTAMRNSSLQGAYLMLAARALGIDCGPMSGFHADKVNQTFFAGTNYQVNFICNLGYGDASKLHPRLPRLSFAEACKIV